MASSDTGSGPVVIESDGDNSQEEVDIENNFNYLFSFHSQSSDKSG